MMLLSRVLLLSRVVSYVGHVSLVMRRGFPARVIPGEAREGSVFRNKNSGTDLFS